MQARCGFRLRASVRLGDVKRNGPEV